MGESFISKDFVAYNKIFYRNQ